MRHGLQLSRERQDDGSGRAQRAPTRWVWSGGGGGVSLRLRGLRFRAHFGWLLAEAVSRFVRPYGVGLRTALRAE